MKKLFTAHAGDLRWSLGSEFAALDIDEHQHEPGNYFFFSAALEYGAGGLLSGGFSFAFSDLDETEERGLMADAYLKYSLRPMRKFNPFISAGASAAALRYREYGWFAENDDAGNPVYYQSVSRTARSIGAIYQVGTTFGIGRRLQLDVYWSQFFGTEEVSINLIGIRGSF
ncbi:MAG: hypothetical protein HZB24_04780 [Desulfobacterales bacterium]|nr:hypothetical protein [Desulfobacterales bacterium]